MNILFICNQGENRSRTAAEIFQDRANTRYAGLYNNIVSEEQIDWADLIIVMKTRHRTEIGRRYPEQYLRKQIISLEIPDIYHHDQPELIEALESSMQQII